MCIADRLQECFREAELTRLLQRKPNFNPAGLATSWKTIGLDHYLARILIRPNEERLVIRKRFTPVICCFAISLEEPHSRNRLFQSRIVFIFFNQRYLERWLEPPERIGSLTGTQIKHGGTGISVWMRSTTIEFSCCHEAQQRWTRHCHLDDLRPELSSLLDVTSIRGPMLVADQLDVVSVALLEVMRQLGIEIAQMLVNASFRITVWFEYQRPCINPLANLPYRRKLDSRWGRCPNPSREA